MEHGAPSPQEQTQCWLPVYCNSSLSAIATTVSDYWYYYPQKMVHGNSSPLLGWPSFIKWKSGWLTLQEGGKKRGPPGEEKKRALCKTQQLLWCLMNADTAEWRQNVPFAVLFLSFFFLSPYAFSDSITRELMEALSWNFLNNKMVTLCNYLDPNAQENLVAIFLSRNSSPSPSALFQESYTRIILKSATCLSGTSEIK